MASKVFALLSLLSLLGICVAQNCIWADLNTSDCDAELCPIGTYEATSGKAGACNPEERYICKNGRRRLCCQNDLETHNCKWVGTAPFCTSTNCPNGQVSIAQDGWGSGEYCVTGCKLYCCDP